MADDQIGPAPDVTILGAGIVGIMTALSLAERGFRVALIDRNPPAEGASYGNAGSLSPWSCVPQSMPGIWKSVPGWLLDPEGPVALRLGYAARFLPWAVKFLQAGQVDRLPAPACCRLLGVSLPRFALAPFEASAPAKVRVAVRAATRDGNVSK